MTATLTLTIFVLAASTQTTSATQSMTGPATSTTDTSGETSRKSAAETSSSTKAPSKVAGSTRNETRTKESPSEVAATATTTTETEAGADALATTKLSFEVEKLGKLNVEGLSRRALLWMVILVIVAVLIAGIAGKLVAAESSSSSAPIVTLGVVAAMAGLAVFFVMRSRLAPLRGVETTAVSLRDSVQTATFLVGRQERRIRQLETAMTDATSRIAKLPTIEAELLIERDRLSERERELAAAAAETQAIRDQLKSMIAIAEEQREQMLRMRYVRTAMWLTWSVLVLAILAGYHVLLWRSRRIPYAHIENIVEHYLRRRGPM